MAQYSLIKNSLEIDPHVWEEINLRHPVAVFLATSNGLICTVFFLTYLFEKSGKVMISDLYLARFIAI